MDGRKGEKSSQTGAVLMMSSAILLALSMIILDILKISPPPIALVSNVSVYIHVDDMLPMKCCTNQEYQQQFPCQLYLTP